jgi:hypothetical protein
MNWLGVLGVPHPGVSRHETFRHSVPPEYRIFPEPQIQCSFTGHSRVASADLVPNDARSAGSPASAQVGTTRERILRIGSEHLNAIVGSALKGVVEGATKVG